jgi:CRP-like cAMP-binding protein
MSHTTSIIRYIRNVVELSDEESSFFASHFEEVCLKKRQLFIQPGFPVDHVYYVVKGALRSYVISKEGNDHTISFAIDDWWLSDYNSFFYRKPASLFAVALEDSIVLKLKHSDLDLLKKANHKFESFFATFAEKALAFHLRRITSNLTLSAEERYREFIEEYPEVVNRVPQYALASYLGMSAEFLSRIRSKTT